MLDPSFTLFGKRIQVNSELELELEVEVEKSCSNEHLHEDEVIEEVTEEETMENNQPDISSAEQMDESTNAPAISETTCQIEKETDSEKNQDENKPNDKKNELKKPDKILPCPRCNSMDTKFCYYNNYNVNQPRHFCKKCQRYWTAGGTMRNVPVGAGRRMNKSSTSRYCQISVDVANGVHYPDGLKTNGTVLTFGSDNPVPDRSSVFHNNNIRGRENGDDHSSGSAVTTSSIEDRSKKCAQGSNQQFNGFPNQMQCFQWPYVWNPALPYFPSAYPMPIYPHPYWNGAPFPCNAPWVPAQKNSESNPNPPTLGKHTRDGEVKSPSTVLVPKTLRIDDPDEAAKSSIWTTLGIKKDKSDPVRKGFFNSLHSKGLENNDCEIEALPSLIKANPVALCRSFRFQERAVL